MMKIGVKSLFVLILVSLFQYQATAQSKGSVTSELSKKSKIKSQKLIWSDEFNDGTINSANWDTVLRGTADWDRYMSNDPSLIYFEDGSVVLEGRVNPDAKTPEDKYVTGGLWSKGKFGFKNGRVDIRAKLGEAVGAWPAFWLLPDVDGTIWQDLWPHAGEIDIMEHLNSDPYIYQTLHSNYTYVLKKTDEPKNYRTAKINNNEYNVYSLAWNDEVVQWFVNGKPTHMYPRVKDDEVAEQGQWPFENPMFIILSQQVGGAGTWVGEINDEDLPVKMWIDYVRVYEYED